MAPLLLLFESGGGGATPPTIAITIPTSSPTFSTNTTPLTVGGTATAGTGTLTSVTWVNSAGGSGTATGTASWSASIPMQPGSNVITVTVHDSLGAQGQAVLTVTFTDITPPTITIVVPTGAPTFVTAATTLTVSGVAADNVAVSSVTWTNSAGGSGTATGTTNWTIPNIALAAGSNILTVTAHDASGNTTPAVLTVTQGAQTFPPPDIISPVRTVSPLRTASPPRT